MRNIRSPNKKTPAVNYPGMPNAYTGPFGTPPKGRAPAPYWYLKKNEAEPMRGRALRDAFQGAAKPVQRKVNRQRRPSDRMRGY